MDWAETNSADIDEKVTITLTKKQLTRTLLIVCEKLSRLKEIANDPNAHSGTKLVMRGEIPEVKELEELFVEAADKAATN